MEEVALPLSMEKDLIPTLLTVHNPENSMELSSASPQATTPASH